MMKKLTALVMLLVMALCCCTAQADETMQKFQPYTRMKLDVLEKYGFTTVAYDDFTFTAEFRPAMNTINCASNSEYDDKYTIEMVIKADYSGGYCHVFPYLIFTRKGSYTYYDDVMETVYIRNGENRYKVDVSGCARYSNGNGTAMDISAEVLGMRGMPILEEIINSNNTIHVKFDNYGGSDITLSAEDIEVLANFYNACKEAGFCEQMSLSLYDDYSTITQFNK